jgi:hypothetical protein
LYSKKLGYRASVGLNIIDAPFPQKPKQCAMDFEARAEIEALKIEHQRLASELTELKLSRRQRAIRAMKRNKRAIFILGLSVVIMPVAVFALSITKTFTFNAGNPTVAAEVNTNFDQLFTKVNDLAAYHPPIGAILAWHKSLSGTPGLPASGEWVECNGQTLSDPASPYNTQVIPNLNGDAAGANSPGQPAKIALFLRGGLISGLGQQDSRIGTAGFISRTLAHSPS